MEEYTAISTSTSEDMCLMDGATTQTISLKKKIFNTFKYTKG